MPGLPIFAKIISIILPLAAIGIIISLATMPTSDVKDLDLLPQPVAIYLDTNDVIRNLLGGLMLQLFIMLPVLFWMPAARRNAAILLSLILSVFIFTAAEMVQLLLPARTFDVRDILLGALGAGSSAAGGFLFTNLLGLRTRPSR